MSIVFASEVTGTGYEEHRARMAGRRLMESIARLQGSGLPVEVIREPVVHDALDREIIELRVRYEGVPYTLVMCIVQLYDDQLEDHKIESVDFEVRGEIMSLVDAQRKAKAAELAKADDV